MDSLRSSDTIPPARYVQKLSSVATAMAPAARGLAMRVSGLAPLDVAPYDRPGDRHFWVHPQSRLTATVIDRTGFPDDGWAIARILADVFHNVGRRETVTRERARHRRALKHATP